MRGEEGGEGNVKYPESLEYFKEVATYWIDKFEIDGWRLDQAYQLCQEGHNYWCEISEAVHQLCERRRAEGKEWGVLGYMVGEVWTGAEGVNDSVYQDFGLKSAFDFDGKMRISGEMGDIGDAGLNNGWDDVVTTYSAPTERGYCSDEILPNLFLSNHDGYRVADRFYDEGQEINLMTRFAILAGYPGPVTLYYGDELADLSRDAEGSQPDNASRTTGHIAPDDDRERHLLNYVRDVFEFRMQNPAMWRGTQEFNRYRKDDAEVLVITKQDTESENKVVMVFADRDVTLNVEGVGEEVEVKGFVPQLFKLQ